MRSAPLIRLLLKDAVVQMRHKPPPSVIPPTAICQFGKYILVFVDSRWCNWINLIKQPPLQPSIPYWSHPALCHLLSYHGDGDPHSEAEGEVLSVRDVAFTYRQAVTRGETWLCHYCLRWGGEMSHTTWVTVCHSFCTMNLKMLPKGLCV